ncbi:DUF5666 domain-containing protein [Hydrogenovibrio thermophilus]|uniref:DUF5666 domain-containing protein n=1 Tax=Hydrogenovibrio thermophilus TaxID=265883 RepID=A0A451G4R7_9GAMM|nr:DUF5666 domain-containing protein [Hydrogenovibrio thermophilus]QAB14476.1 hypothetical protein EPV75_01735 [Hydrogenovibrio thermophilus]
MKKRLMLATLPTALALALYGCGGGSSSDSSSTTAGIGGTGYVSSGTITGFGSVFVNGVEFETDSSSFDIEGVSGTQGDLAIGMVVKVNGSINADGITGTATSISYDDDIQGPVSGLTSLSPDQKSFTVLGTTVIADINTTSYDGTNFDFTTLANNNNVEVSGFYNASNQLIATRIELKDVTFDNTSEVELKGTITGLTGTAFTLNGVNIDASAAELSDLPNGLTEGAYVEAKGTYNGVDTIIASKVEGKDDSIEDTDEFEVEGYVSGYAGLADFKVNQIPVDASNATLSPPSLTLEDNMQVEAEGQVVNGTLIASELKLRSGEIKIKATVSAVDAANNTFTISPVSGQPAITVHVGTETEMENDLLDTDSFSVNDLNPATDFVEIEGYDNGDGNVFATEVKVKEVSDIVVQGVIEAGTGSGTTIKVLGVEFQISTPAETSFENTDGTSMIQTEFFNAVTLGQSVVKIEDKVTTNGTADTIEIESL